MEVAKSEGDVFQYGVAYLVGENSILIQALSQGHREALHYQSWEHDLGALLVVDSQELDNVGMLESTQYRTFFPEATNRVFLLVERLVEVLSCACEALVFDGVDGSVGASSQFHSSLSYSLECVLLQSCCLIRFSSSLRHHLQTCRRVLQKQQSTCPQRVCFSSREWLDQPKRRALQQSTSPTHYVAVHLIPYQRTVIAQQHDCLRTCLYVASHSLATGTTCT